MRTQTSSGEKIPVLCQLKYLRDIEIQDVKQYENRDQDRPEFENRYRKILYFMFREGFSSTIRKFKAHHQVQKRYLTFLTVSFRGKNYLNVSIQSQTEPGDFILRNTFYESEGIPGEWPHDKLEEALERFNQFCTDPDYTEIIPGALEPVAFEEVVPVPESTYANGLFIFGLGGYVRMFIIHHFRRMKKIACVDYKSSVTEKFQSNYGFDYGYLLPSHTDPLLKNVVRPVAIIATHHSDHAGLAHRIFNLNPNSVLFIEKPPAVTLKDIEMLIDLYNRGAVLEIGFNRRYIGFSRYIREKVYGHPVIITCSVKEVNISKNHWYLWMNQGTRVTGNVVHWFDLGSYWINSIPVEINVMAHPDDQETSSISVLYKDGSILNISASDRGNSLRGVQEKIELRFGNETIFINDFNSMVHLHRNGSISRKRKILRKKGHETMYREFNRLVSSGSKAQYPAGDLVKTSLVTFYASQMIRNNTRSMHIEEKVAKYLGFITSG